MVRCSLRTWVLPHASFRRPISGNCPCLVGVALPSGNGGYFITSGLCQKLGKCAMPGTHQRPPAERGPGPFEGPASSPQLCWWSLIEFLCMYFYLIKTVHPLISTIEKLLICTALITNYFLDKQSFICKTGSIFCF
jgi:hypothetical protein